MSFPRTIFQLAAKRCKSIFRLIFLIGFVAFIINCLNFLYTKKTVPSFSVVTIRPKNVSMGQSGGHSINLQTAPSIIRQQDVLINKEKNVSSTCNKNCFSADFPFSIDLPDLCKGDVDLVIVIPVTAGGHSARNVVRNTWLSPVRNLLRFRKIRYMFLIGQPDNEDMRQKIQVESMQYKDIVVSEFKDTYRNLTIKTVVAMKWISTRCSNTKFFMKTDDDVWVNVTNLVTMLKRHGSQLRQRLGGVCRSIPVRRNVASKWHATYEEFSNDVYDPYCSGTGYVGGIDVAKGIAQVYDQIPYFHLEDVFVGICLKKLGYQVLLLKHFDNTSGPTLSDCKVKKGGYITMHKIPEKRMQRIYNATCR